MSCTDPLKGFIIEHKKNTINNKYNIKITRYKVHHLEKINNTIVAAYDEYTSPNSTAIYTEYMEIPCGKCLACQLDYAREWATRCVLEAQMYDESCFITFTYDEEHLKLAVNDEGEFTPTLVKKDVQGFIKRLRRHLEYRGYDKKIRYFGCGEYGENSKRPHYHLILFGWKPDDLVFYKLSHDKRIMYNSCTLEKIWKHGFCVIGDVSFKSAGYVARYVTKKLKNEAPSSYKSYNIEPEFVLMSRNRGIGYPWYQANFNVEMFTHPYVYINGEDSGRKLLIPEYVYNCAAEDYPLEYEDFLNRRAEGAIKTAELKDRIYNLPREKIRDIEFENLQARTKKLIRSL